MKYLESFGAVALLAICIAFVVVGFAFADGDSVNLIAECLGVSDE